MVIFMKKYYRLTAFFLIAASSQLSAADIYLSPNGDDTNDGTSPSHSVATLPYAIQLAQNHFRQNAHEVRILVQKGTYLAQSVAMNIDKGTGKLSITGESNDPASFPVFDGSGSATTWLTLKSSRGIDTGLTIQGLKITNYFTAISLEGNRDVSNLNNYGTIIRRNIFSNIGSIASIDANQDSTAAIRLVNSKNNLIENNFFKSIRNKKGCGALHSIYVAHFSSGNKIINNTFDDVCGSAIKLRDRSDNNLIQGNRFSHLENVPAIEEWFCDMGARKDCTKKLGECPSTENLQQGNLVLNSGSSPLISIVGNLAPRPWCTQDDFGRPRISTPNP